MSRRRQLLMKKLQQAEHNHVSRFYPRRVPRHMPPGSEDEDYVSAPLSDRKRKLWDKWAYERNSPQRRRRRR